MKIFNRKIIKIISYIIGYPIYGISKVIPRKKNLWVIGSKDCFSCNSKFFFISFYEKKKKGHYNDIELIWITPNKKIKEKLNKLGLPCEYKYSFRGFFFLLLSKVYITSYGTHYDLSFWTSGNSFKVYLWHGVGIKNINYASDTPEMKRIYKPSKLIDKLRFFPYREKPDTFISTSPLMTEHFSKAFNINFENIIESNYPRCNIFDFSENELHEFIDKFEDRITLDLINLISNYKLVFFYMPTWRDNNDSFFEKNNWDMNKLNDSLYKKNILFLIKLHPNTNFNIDNNFQNIKIINNKIDPYPILPFINILITDYSSIYYDFILKKNYSTILFPYDKQEYISSCRDLAYSYDEYTGGRKIYQFEELITIIENFHSDIIYNNSEDIKEIFWSPQTKKIDITEYIISKINDVKKIT